MADRPDARSLRIMLRHHLRGRQGTAIRYTPELRARIVAFVRDREKEGASLAAATRVLGLRYATVRPWLCKEPRLRRIKIVAATVTPRRDPVLVTPFGVRVEGLDLDAIATLLRTLA